jgi:hypothetical protein
MQENKVIDGMIYSEEMDHYVDIKEWLQHVMSVAHKAIYERFELDLRWTSCSDEKGNSWKEPYIKVYTGQQARDITQLLNDEGFDAAVDCYEADDGDEYPGGPPIMLKFWSVKLLGIKVKKEVEI